MLLPGSQSDEIARGPDDSLSVGRDDGRKQLPSISCVIPALNEQRNLRLLLPRLCVLLGQIGSAWEIIVVDDGSSDDTPEMMAGMIDQPGVCYLQLSRNFGKEAALSAGLEASSGQVVVCLDADLQHPLELIPKMIARWRDGVETVYAVKADRRQEPWLIRIGASIFYRIVGQDGRVAIPRNAGDFRLMDRRVVDALIRLPERTRFMKGLYAWVGFSAEPLVYQPAERVHGQTNFNLFKLLRLAVDGITAFSTWPLRAFSVLGVLLALISFGYGSFLVFNYLLNGHQISGWTTIVTAMFFFSGLNLIALGIIGAYLARIFDEVKARPLYVVKTRLGRPLSGPSS
ncbi:MAG TPA: glycosyltransferase family 2 protein [Accumulibacter sp.]|nr:glycosyltransferase family 2 protein [Accumulibacter sp.]HNL77326.1 glycosyltransferase family 2 protein [Accumulibacter sp.]HNO57451.1 glycosyltransferase family 2 protein [Accumulibacter sp.]